MIGSRNEGEFMLSLKNFDYKIINIYTVTDLNSTFTIHVSESRNFHLSMFCIMLGLVCNGLCILCRTRVTIVEDNGDLMTFPKTWKQYVNLCLSYVELMQIFLSTYITFLNRLQYKIFKNTCE